ncbi:MAG TPA: PadR family transcriptional regulator [Acidimicrobiales bacterium]|jgi:DNA-binding PadR family transcriptional regulator|nr:PadR family transcriptional regulator [Acidimicrobiales bacterium]
MRDRRFPHLPHMGHLGHMGRNAFWGPFPPGAFRSEFDPRGSGRRGGRGRGRRNRGDVRAALLALLAERPMHGYEMIQELDSRTGGIWRPSPGSVYPTLQLLEDEGLITSEEGEGRRRFTLTDAGREEAAKVTEAPPWTQYADDDTLSAVADFRKASLGVMNALSEVGFSGSDQQRAQALEVLADTRRKLYAILAEDETEPETGTV